MMHRKTLLPPGPGTPACPPPPPNPSLHASMLDASLSAVRSVLVAASSSSSVVVGLLLWLLGVANDQVVDGWIDMFRSIRSMHIDQLSLCWRWPARPYRRRAGAGAGGNLALRRALRDKRRLHRP